MFSFPCFFSKAIDVFVMGCVVLLCVVVECWNINYSVVKSLDVSKYIELHFCFQNDEPSFVKLGHNVSPSIFSFSPSFFSKDIIDVFVMGCILLLLCVVVVVVCFCVCWNMYYSVKSLDVFWPLVFVNKTISNNNNNNNNNSSRREISL